MVAIRRATPMVPVDVGKNKSPGRSTELTNLKNSSKKLYKKWIRSDKHEDRERYVTKRNEYKSLLRRTKLDAWKDFCASCESLSATARLNKILSKTNFQWNRMMKRADGTYTLTPDEAVSLMLDAHFPGNREDELTEELNFEEMNTKHGLVSHSKVSAAIETVEPYKVGVRMKYSRFTCKKVRSG